MHKYLFHLDASFFVVALLVYFSFSPFVHLYVLSSSFFLHFTVSCGVAFNFNIFLIWGIVLLLQTNETGTYSLGTSEIRTTADFRSVNELACPLPSGQSTGSYWVSITNDNTLRSSVAMLIVYDSRCFDCSASTSLCVQKVSSYSALLMAKGFERLDIGTFTGSVSLLVLRGFFFQNWTPCWINLFFCLFLWVSSSNIL